MGRYAEEIYRKSRGSSVCITPVESENVIRKFYGLPDPGERKPEPEVTLASDIVKLEDLVW